MTTLGLFSLLLVLATLFGIFNHRFLRLPMTAGVLLIALLFSLALMGLDVFRPEIGLVRHASEVLHRIDLPDLLLNGMLAFLLFAGALHVDLRHLRDRFLGVGFLALFGTILAVGLFGGSFWLVTDLLGRPLPVLWCLLLGAILAPTDPVSVVGMLKRLGLPAPLQALFAGESLLNDGVGIIMFGTIMILLTDPASHGGLPDVLHAFAQEALGGGLLGWGLGWVGLQVLHSARDRVLEVLVSFSLAGGTYSLANGLGMSGPVAVVMAGLWLGSGRAHAMLAPDSRAALENVWHILDEVLNAVLFLLIGFEAIVAFSGPVPTVLALAALPLSIFARAASVFLSTMPMHLRGDEKGKALALLTWGGLRGGISLSLALSLPAGPMKDMLLPICYGVVIFTILVQGLTIAPVVRWLYPATDRTKRDHPGKIAS